MKQCRPCRWHLSLNDSFLATSRQRNVLLLAVSLAVAAQSFPIIIHERRLVRPFLRLFQPTTTATTTSQWCLPASSRRCLTIRSKRDNDHAENRFLDLDVSRIKSKRYQYWHHTQDETESVRNSDTETENETVKVKRVPPPSIDPSNRRRDILSSVLASATGWTVNKDSSSSKCRSHNPYFRFDSNVASAAPLMLRSPSSSTAVTAAVPSPASLYVFAPSGRSNTTTFRTPLLYAQLPEAAENLSSEFCLLRLLPVKNKFFRELQATIEGLSPLRLTNAPDTWEAATKNVLIQGVSELDRKRSQLEPVFNPDEDTPLQISKGERFEILIESLRSRLLDMAQALSQRNETATFLQQKNALLVLSEIGELLVAKFPYPVPTEGLYSYLPRLLGRCKVTFTFRRRKTILGNMTLVADGFTAPITAGNFVDLCARDFYTGLPIRFTKKRLGGSGGSSLDFDVANVPILGSFNDGFYDPLTAKLRKLPLELIRVEKGSGEPDLTYSQGLSSLSDSSVIVDSSGNSRPLLSFQIPGLVAMNHPDKNSNGASSEFFSLQKDSMMDDKRKLLDGEYAPFGYIIDGYDLFQQLQPNDVIEETKVSEFGIQNLVKLRRSSFSEAVQGSGDSIDE